jgi:hypothetical protein
MDQVKCLVRVEVRKAPWGLHVEYTPLKSLKNGAIDGA